ncbi:MAG: hypothetical protein M3453_13190, partial [Pseudomonadota bacterium]|nr:hypothetical protein [Pseudomonadota bacterium]
MTLTKSRALRAASLCALIAAAALTSPALAQTAAEPAQQAPADAAPMPDAAASETPMQEPAAGAPAMEPAAEGAQSGRAMQQEMAAMPASGTMERADEDMKTVLTKLQELGAKPFEQLSVEEARSLPTPADAVKAVLEDQGK